MSKAILVMDMPSKCLNCNCVGHINHNGKFNVCRITGDVLNEDYYYKQRPDYCPLREVPQKREEKYASDVGLRDSGFIDGWNHCIDTILKEGAE